MKIQQTRIDSFLTERGYLTMIEKNQYRFGQHLFNYLELHKSNDADKFHFDRIYEMKVREDVLGYMRKHDLIDYQN